MDLMDRQKTIELLEELKAKDPFDRYEKQNIGIDWAIDAVKAASSVLTCDDAVSRQAAIDALEKVAELYPWRVPGDRDSYSSYNEAWQDALNRVENEIEALPSAQPTVHPQRTCVNCGRTVNNGGWYADGRTRCPIEEHYALPKDGYCHLWEKRNVTDDDYPERREE